MTNSSVRGVRIASADRPRSTTVRLAGSARPERPRPHNSAAWLAPAVWLARGGVGVMAMLFVMSPATGQDTPGGRDPIEAGREAFRSVAPRWYDPDRDAVRPSVRGRSEPYRTPVEPGLRASDWLEAPPPPKSPSNPAAPRTTTSTGWNGWAGWTGWSGLGDLISNLGTVCLWGSLGVALLAIAAALVWFVRRMTYLRTEADDNDDLALETEAERAARMESLPLAVRRNLDDLLGEAERLRTAGRFDQAIVCLYGHMLVTLDRRQIIRLLPGRTNRQYLRQATSVQPGLGPILEPVIVTFEESYFGGKSLGRERVEACWAVLPAFQAQLGSGAHQPTSPFSPGDPPSTGGVS